MPIFVQFWGKTVQMTPQSLRTWLAQGGCAYPPPNVEAQVLDKYLQRRTKTYPFLQQREFIDDLADYAQHLDLGISPRESLRLAHFIRTLAGGRVDYTQNPEDDGYLHPQDLPQLNNAGPGLIMEHLAADEMFDLCDVLIVAETHKCHSASKYLHISHAFLGGASKKYEIRVMLDGIAQMDGHECLSRYAVNKNFPFIDNVLFDAYQFYGLEPRETQMFSTCEKILNLSLKQQREAAEWLYFNIREDEAINKAVKAMGLPYYNQLMDDANAFASGTKLTTTMLQAIALAGRKLEWGEKSAIRMDANLAWGRAIEEVLAKPPTGPLEVRVLVLCGENHVLSRSLHGVPVQGAIKHARVRALVISSNEDPSKVMDYRTVSGSLNYVFTIPESFVDLKHFFVKPRVQFDG